MGNSIRRKLASHEPQLPRHTQDPFTQGSRLPSGLGLHGAEFWKCLLGGDERIKAKPLAWEGVWLGEEHGQDSVNQQGHLGSLWLRQKSSRDPEQEPSKPQALKTSA